jgi:uroporphyrinogen-III synthase
MSQKTVVLTASASALPGLAVALARMSIKLETRPLLSFEPPLDWGPMDAALAQRQDYQAVALTSPRAAQAFAERLDVNGIVWNRAAPQVWVVGPATQEALRSKAPARRPNTSPQPGTGAAAWLAGAMVKAGVGSPVFFPCGDRRRDELPKLLHTHGIRVDEVVCYRTVLASREQAREAVAGSSVVIVASPSVVGLLADACPGPPRPRLIAIGSTTAEAARAAGWPPAAAAGEPSTPALAASITDLLAPR